MRTHSYFYHVSVLRGTLPIAGFPDPCSNIAKRTEINSCFRVKSMWLLKGVGFGLLVFAAFFVVYFATHIAGGLRQNAAIGLSAITGSAIYRALFWVGLLLTLSASCARTKLLTR